ncbi:MAG TPA: COX aromatic rich motif-containing protein [Acidiphilium sp.]
MTRRVVRLSGWVALLALGGCSSRGFRLFDPAGPISKAEAWITVVDVAVMMLIILPTTLMICLFLWRYRRTRNAAYDPVWSHSLPLEIAMWGVPLAIVGFLAYVVVQGTYAVNPYAPRILANRALVPHTGNALTVDVVATDWQWLFIYPKQHIAMVDRLVIPSGRDIRFRLTSTSVVNGFYIPQLVGMIDAMPGMRTVDSTRATRIGSYEGFSSDLSGAGFSWMRFRTDVVPAGAFQNFVTKTRAGQGDLTYARFQTLAQPTINLHQKPAYFSMVEPHLFRRVIEAARHGKIYRIPPDLTEHMARDARTRAPYIIGASSPG